MHGQEVRQKQTPPAALPPKLWDGLEGRVR